MSQPETQKLAEKIANLLESESQARDVAGLFAAIEKLNYRIEKLEKSLAESRTVPEPLQLHHPSQEKFAIAEAIVDEIFNKKEKACTFEPNGKPCDHCGMCSARGF